MISNLKIPTYSILKGMNVKGTQVIFMQAMGDFLLIYS